MFWVKWLNFFQSFQTHDRKWPKNRKKQFAGHLICCGRPHVTSGLLIALAWKIWFYSGRKVLSKPKAALPWQNHFWCATALKVVVNDYENVWFVCSKFIYVDCQYWIGRCVVWTPLVIIIIIFEQKPFFLVFKCNVVQEKNNWVRFTYSDIVNYSEMPIPINNHDFLCMHDVTLIRKKSRHFFD